MAEADPIGPTANVGDILSPSLTVESVESGVETSLTQILTSQDSSKKTLFIFLRDPF